MRGVVFTGDRQLEIRGYPDPTLGPGEVVLAIKASGNPRPGRRGLPPVRHPDHR